jgi:hypothetical protein
MKNIKSFIFILFLAAISKTSFSQVKIDSAEITSEVRELSDFHDIIFPMWHEAYPSKDIKALKGFVPGIKAAMAKINSAQLPGILREKETAWKDQLKKFNASADAYYKAAAGNVDTELLTAAEKLHSNYEMMVRVLRPVLKEVDDYHQSLYIIYHKLYPSKKYNEIGSMMDNLIAKADLIVKYPVEKLNSRLGAKASQYTSASKELYTATVSLKEVLKGKDDKKKDEAVQNMHSKYQVLESVFK